MKILLSSSLNKLKDDSNLKRPIFFISQIWIKNWIKVPIKVAKARNPVLVRKFEDLFSWLKIQVNKIKKIIVKLVIAGLILDKKNFLWEFKAPKLKPINPDKGIQGEVFLIGK